MNEDICPYANGINESRMSGYCVITEQGRCYDIDDYRGCYFYKKREVENNE